MHIRKIQDVEIKNKKVLLRVDFNVLVENGKAKENFKIKSCKQTLNYLLENENKVALISHFGRPEGKVDAEFSLSQLKNDIENILEIKIEFVDDCIGEKVVGAIENLEKGEVLLLENVRFYKEEERNDFKFSKMLADPFDIFINEAFSVCHRNQSSVTGVAQIVPSFAGFWLQREIESMNNVKDNPQHPAVAIIGGAKIETKLPVIKKFEKNYECVLVGGKVANEAIDQKMNFSDKVILPVDFIGDRFDIGKETIKIFQEKIKNAKTIVWNGPMGKFENEEFSRGTSEILNAVLKSDAYVLMGGGESVQILEENNALEKISFISTGGGAMLDYLSGKEMPGLLVLFNK